MRIPIRDEGFFILCFANDEVVLGHDDEDLS